MYSLFSKKGDETDPTKYGHISPTCVLCKVFEHIVASSISKHVTDQNILFVMQHGFRKKRSCETQHIMLVDELAKNMQSGKQTDLTGNISSIVGVSAYGRRNSGTG